MPEITVTINVPEFADGELREAIITKATDLILQREKVVQYDEDGEEWVEMTPGLLGKLVVKAENRANAAVAEIVDAEIPKVVHEVLSGTFQPMTRWGEPKGEPTTIRAMAGEQAERWLTEMVDRNGKPARYGDDKQVRLHWMIQKMVDKAWQEHLRAESAAMAKEVKAKLNEKLTTDLAATLKRLLGL